MNTKSLPAVLALIAGFVTCIMSIVQGVNTVVFAKRFVIVCIIFFAIGTVVSVIIQMNFKEMADEGEDASKEQNGLEEEDGTEDKDTASADEISE